MTSDVISILAFSRSNSMTSFCSWGSLSLADISFIALVALPMACECQSSCWGLV